MNVYNPFLSCLQTLIIGNGGLDNNIQQEELYELLHPYGPLDDIVMIPRKPYAFAKFRDIKSAAKAYEALNGRTLKCPEEVSIPNITLYLSYTIKGVFFYLA